METSERISRLRIYISSTDKLKHTPLYEAVVFMAKRHGLAGATVFRGEMGYGASSVVHSLKFWELSGKLPIVVEIVDENSKIEKFVTVLMPHVAKMRYGCLITKENVEVVLYKTGKGKF